MGSTGLTFGEFSKYLDTYHILAFDLPGHGNAEKCNKKTDYQPAKLAEKIHEKLSKLEKQSFYLMGHSLGGNIALYYGEKYPEKLKGIILLDGGYITPSEFGSLEEQLQESERHYTESRYDSWKDFIEEEKKEYSSWSKELEVAARARVKEVNNEIQLKVELDTIQAFITVFFEESVKDILERIKVPILLLTASEPEEVNAIRESSCKRFEQLANAATIISIPKAGHDLFSDQPILIAQHINEWVIKNECKLINNSKVNNISK